MKMNGPMCLLFVVLIMLLNPGKSEKIKATMKEVDVLVGDPITVNCTLIKDYPSINSSNLYFKFKNERVDEKYVRRPTASTIELNITAATNMTGHLYCHADNKTETVAHEVVEVHKRPIKPYDLQCVVEDWVKMTCSWKPTKKEQEDHTGLETNQTLYWVLLSKDDFYSGNLSERITCISATKLHNCSPNSMSCVQNSCQTVCDVKFFPTQNYYYLAIIQTYHFNSSKGKQFCDLAVNTKLQRTISVKPGKVRALEVDYLGNWSFSLKWKASKNADPTTELQFKIIFQSQHGKIFQLPLITSAIYPFEDNRFLEHSFIEEEGVKPYTTYTVKISCIPYINNEVMGYWSENETITVKTLSDKPKKAPTIFPGSFELPQSANRLNIFFQPLSAEDRHGILQNISVSIKSVSSSTIKYSRQFAAVDNKKEVITGLTLDYDFDPSKDYIVAIDINTEVGFSEIPSRIYIKNQKSRLATPDQFAVRFNSKEVLAYWTSVKNASTYSVYWCHGHNQYDCMSNNMAMSSKSYKSSQTNSIVYVEVPFLAELKDINDYTFGISAEGGETGYGIPSSGLKFSKCSHNAETNILPPKDFKYDDDINQKPNSLRLIWKDRKCEETDYIEKYVIMYRRKDSLLEKWMKLQVPVSNTSAVLLNLEGGESYIVKVYSKSHWKNSSIIELEQAKAVALSGLSKGGKVGLGITLAVVIIFIIIGLYSIGRKLQKFYKEKKNGPKITLPEVPVTYDVNGEEDDEHMAMVTINDIDSSDIFVMVQNRDNSSKEIAEVDMKMPLLKQNGHAVRPVENSDNLQSCTGDSAMGESLNLSKHEYVNSSSSKLAEELFAAADHGKPSVFPSGDEASGASPVCNEALNQYSPHKSQVNSSTQSNLNGGAENPIVAESVYHTPNKPFPVVDVPEKGTSQDITSSSFEKGNNDDLTAVVSNVVPVPNTVSGSGRCRGGSYDPSQFENPILSQSLTSPTHNSGLSSYVSNKDVDVNNFNQNNEDNVDSMDQGTNGEIENNYIENMDCDKKDSTGKKPMAFLPMNSAGYVSSLPNGEHDENDWSKQRGNTNREDENDKINEAYQAENSEGNDSNDIKETMTKVMLDETLTNGNSPAMEVDKKLSTKDKSTTSSKGSPDLPNVNGLSNSRFNPGDFNESGSLSSNDKKEEKPLPNGIKPQSLEDDSGKGELSHSDDNPFEKSPPLPLPVNTGYITQEQLSKMN